jgi:hypothetical protein
LVIRKVAGRGGKSGVSYELSAASLPLDLRIKGGFKPSQTPFQAPASGSEAEMRWWAHHLTPLVELHTADRDAALEELAAREHLNWKQQPKRYALKTWRNHLRDLKRKGFSARKGRVDRGRKRTIISLRWDKAVPFDEATKRHIAENLKQVIREKRADRLMKETSVRGLVLPDENAFQALYTIPMDLYTAEAKYEVVYDLNKDRDRFDDNLPRGGKRTSEGQLPLWLVLADTHPLDLLIRRSDGSIGTAKLLAFMDYATRRVWVEVVMIEGQGGVRNTDQIKAFVSLSTNPSAGVPENLYFDNGAEYRFSEYLEDMFALVGRYGGRIVKAIPHNAQAKGLIEGWFHRFESDYLRQVPGWHGGKLGAPKRPARGKLPAPFEGGFDLLCDVIQAMVHAYNVTPQPYGELAGDSPNSRFAKFVKAGWAATVLDPAELLTVFTLHDTRVVRQHGISVDGRTWSCPEMDEYFGKTVTVKIPQLGLGYNELWVGDEHGKTLGIARPDEKASPLDNRQAQHSADRKSRTVAAARKLQRDVAGRPSAMAEIIDFGRARPPVEPNPPHGRLSVGGGDDGRAFCPKAAPDREAEIQASHESTRERLAFFKKGLE